MSQPHDFQYHEAWDGSLNGEPEDPMLEPFDESAQAVDDDPLPPDPAIDEEEMWAARDEPPS